MGLKLQHSYFLPDGDESSVDKKKKQLETMKKRALSSDIMRDLQKQYDDRPEEVVVRVNKGSSNHISFHVYANASVLIGKEK